MPDCCPACQDNADARRRAEADLAEALAVLDAVAMCAGLVSAAAVGAGLDGADWTAIDAARAIVDRHRPPETWRRGGGAS